VIEIFNKKEETGKYAALHTLMSGVMRAGYCIGVLQQFINSSPFCRNDHNLNCIILAFPLSALCYSNVILTEALIVDLHLK